MLLFLILKLVISANMNGQEIKVNFWGNFLWVVIFSTILYFGGFWG
jgi:hypothetical protein